MCFGFYNDADAADLSRPGYAVLHYDGFQQAGMDNNYYKYHTTIQNPLPGVTHKFQCLYVNPDDENDFFWWSVSTDKAQSYDAPQYLWQPHKYRYRKCQVVNK